MTQATASVLPIGSSKAEDELPPQCPPWKSPSRKELARPCLRGNHCKWHMTLGHTALHPLSEPGTHGSSLPRAGLCLASEIFGGHQLNDHSPVTWNSSRNSLDLEGVGPQHMSQDGTAPACTPALARAAELHTSLAAST